MSIRLRNNLIFTFSFFLALAIYWPAMKGQPIWDDVTFWFTAPEMTPSQSYIDIWKYFGWPFSVSVQKLMLSVFEKNYFNYHLTNFIIHFANSLLIFKLGRLFRLKYPMMFFALFLFHPVCVISTAWMVQIKTLLCLFFALATILTFVKGQKDTKWMVFSWILFALSITSKSSSVTLPVIFVIMNLRLHRFNKLYLLIPFFLLSGWSTYRVLKSKVTIEGANKAAVATSVKEPEAPKVEAPKPQVAVQPVIIPKSKPVVEVKKPELPKVVKKEKPKKQKKIKISKPKVEPKPELKPEIKPESAPVVATAPVTQKTADLPPPVNLENQTVVKENYQKISNVEMVLQTLHYYFWQSLVPFQNAPIKGLNYQHPGFEHYMHLFFLVCMIVVLLKDSALLYLGAAHFLLLPFLGIIPAPYMNITWVSDQHLYLVLPCLIGFWLRIIDRLKWKYAYAIPSFFLVLFMIITFRTTPIYKDQFEFYESSLDYNPTNVAVAYNLAFAQIMSGHLIEAESVLDQTMDEAERNPLMKKNQFYPYIIYLKVKMTPVQ